MVNRQCDFFETCPTRETLEKLKANYKDGAIYHQLKRVDLIFRSDYCNLSAPPSDGFKNCPTYLHLNKQ